MPNRENIRFNALRNALYHTARRRAFERMNRWFNFAMIMVGAAGFSDMLGRYGVDTIYFGVIVAAIAAAQLAFDFGGSARDHQSFQRDYYNLLADIEEVQNPNEEQLASWLGRMTRIAGDEPPIMRALDAKAYNDTIDALDWDKDERLYLPIWHRLLGRFSSYDGHEFPKICELPNYKPKA